MLLCCHTKLEQVKGEELVHGKVGSSQSSEDDIDSTCIELKLAKSLAKALQLEEAAFSTSAACKQHQVQVV
jgi:hypothetical protein